jgi:hypothetical protein
MRIKVPKLPIISKAPSKRAHHIDAILPNRLQDLTHEALVVPTPRTIERLVWQIFFGFPKDGKPELGNDDGGFECVPKIREIGAEVCWGEVYI